jgi:multidrug efflux pump subunit AcrB
MGVTPQALDTALYSAFGQRQVSTMYTGINQYHVIMEVLPDFQQNPISLNSIYVPSATGPAVPLSTFTHVKTELNSLTVNHQGLFPSITLSFALAPGIALSEATAAVDQAELEIGMPASVHGAFAGTAQVFQASLKSEPLLILAALLAVYIVLGILYESYAHPITILSTLPSAGVGALLALLIFNVDLTVIALIGIILLIGIVKKNAILMIDFALDAERKQQISAKNAIYHDDDHGGIVRRTAVGTGNRHRLRDAPAAGHRHCRRPGRESNSNAVHNPGRVYLHGETAGLDGFQTAAQPEAQESDVRSASLGLRRAAK